MMQQPRNEQAFAEPYHPRTSKAHHFTRYGTSALVVLLVVAFGLGMVADRIIWSYGPSAGAESSLTDQPQFATFQQTWDLIHENYVDTGAIDNAQLLYGAARGMVDALGDTGHSTFLDPQETVQMATQEQGEYVGIGIEIDLSTGRPVVVAAFDDSPAQKAGIRAQDVILSIDGVPTDGMTSTDVTTKLRGKAGTDVALTLQHATDSTPYTVTLTRATITIKPVSWGMLPNHLMLIRISQFSRGAGDGVKDALAAAQTNGTQGIVLDLRDNPGGLVDEAIAVASQFLPQGKTIYLSQGRDGKPKAVKSYGDGTGRDLPMIVLVNNGSASASEIVAGGLRDNGRAEIVGEKTFGTGTVLQQFNMKDGSSVVLGIRLWLTPNGDQIWHKGITPTDIVALAPDGEQIRPAATPNVTSQQLAASTDNQMQAAVKLLVTQMTNKKSVATPVATPIS